jgi:endonuclease/exonuclease/phosphatase (EEP) superfamily protein YafD
LNQKAEDPAQVAVQPGGKPRRKRKPTGRFECQIGLLLGLGGLIGSRLGQLWIAFDVFSQFTLQFGLVTLAFIVGILMPRAKLLAAFLVIILGLLAIGFWPHVASRTANFSAPAIAGERALRVASFNTLYVNEQVEAVQEEVLRLDADVIVLLEMGPNKRRILEAVKDRYPHQAHCYGIDYCNLVILSKLPIVETDARAIWDGAPYIRAKLGPEAGGLTVFGVHTIRFPHSRAQFRQVKEISDLIEALPGPKLVMGDFNATPFSRIIETVEDRANLVLLTGLPSWPSTLGLPQIAIDHMFVSPGIRALSGQVLGEPAGSDHFPIALSIGIPSAP